MHIVLDFYSLLRKGVAKDKTEGVIRDKAGPVSALWILYFCPHYTDEAEAQEVC